jgi:hypothetical protein
VQQREYPAARRRWLQVRVVAMFVLLVGTACAYEPFDADPAAGGVELDDDAKPVVAIEPAVSTDAVREPLWVPETVGPQQWRFAVLSDLHLPNPRSAVIDRTVSALIALGVRLVVVTGD